MSNVQEHYINHKSARESSKQAPNILMHDFSYFKLEVIELPPHKPHHYNCMPDPVGFYFIFLGVTLLPCYLNGIRCYICSCLPKSYVFIFMVYDVDRLALSSSWGYLLWMIPTWCHGMSQCVTKYTLATKISRGRKVVGLWFEVCDG